MQAISINRFVTPILALSLSAIALPTWAVTGITSCRDITSPGSYRLTQDINFQGTNSDACLAIKASDVTIDLQGHTLRGNGVGKGIDVNTLPLPSNIEVRNGTVTSFRSGIFLSVANGARVERMRVLDNAFSGIFVSVNGEGGSVISSNIVTRNPQGIFVSGNGLIIDNNASANDGNGIELRGTGTVRGNVTNANRLNGISVRCPALVIENTAVGNARGDLRTSGSGCRASNNLAPTLGN